MKSRLAEASFAFRGYPRKSRGQFRAMFPTSMKTSVPAGRYARHPVNTPHTAMFCPLVTQQDDRFVIIGSGDEVALEFDAEGLPSLRPGWTRDYFLYADGFAKDMDFYSAYSSPSSRCRSMRWVSIRMARKPRSLQMLRIWHIVCDQTRALRVAVGNSYRFRYPSGQSGRR